MKSIFENALVVELQRLGHKIDQQKSFCVNFKDHCIGTLVPDTIVDDLVIVDTKVVSVFNENHMVQMIGYLAITGLDLAMLLNFKFAKLQWKRVVRGMV